MNWLIERKRTTLIIRKYLFWLRIKHVLETIFHYRGAASTSWLMEWPLRVAQSKEQEIRQENVNYN